MSEQDELQAEWDGQYGDPRRCPVHGTVISSPCGMFDGLCSACEAMDDATLPPGWEDAPLSAQIAFLVAGDDPEAFDTIKAQLKGETEMPF